MIAVDITAEDYARGGSDPSAVLAPAIARASSLDRIAADIEDIRLRPVVIVRRGPAVMPIMDSRSTADYTASTTWYVNGLGGKSIEMPYRAQVLCDAIKYGPGIGAIWVRDKMFRAGIPERYEVQDKTETVKGVTIAYKIVQTPWVDIVKPTQVRMAISVAQGPNALGLWTYGLREDK